MDRSIILPEDNSRILEVLRYYNQNKRRFKTTYISKYERFQDLEQEYLDVSGTRSKRQEIRDMKMEGADKFYEDINWKVYAITTEEAACYYGRGTRWCTAATTSGHNYAKEYLDEGPLFIFIDRAGDKFQADAKFDVILNAEDMELSDDDHNEILDLVSGMRNTEYDMYLEYAIIRRIEKGDYYPDENGEALYIENLKSEMQNTNDIGSIASMAYNYVQEQVDIYDLDSLEDIISQDASTSLRYADNILKSRRFKKGEEVIAETASVAVVYAREIIKGRFPEAEENIASYPTHSGSYAKWVIKGRWPLGEDAISKNGTASSKYAFEVIKDRFPEGEEAIKNGDPRVWTGYVTEFLSDSDDALEMVLETKNLEGIVSYAIKTDERIPEVEDMIETYTDFSVFDTRFVRSVLEYSIHFKVFFYVVIGNMMLSKKSNTNVIKYIMEYNNAVGLDSKMIEIIGDQILVNTTQMDIDIPIWYSEVIMKERWEEMEEQYFESRGIIDPYEPVDYAIKMKVRLSLKSETMMFDHSAAAKYAYWVIGDKFPIERMHKEILDVSTFTRTNDVKMYQELYGDK